MHTKFDRLSHALTTFTPHTHALITSKTSPCPPAMMSSYYTALQFSSGRCTWSGRCALWFLQTQGAVWAVQLLCVCQCGSVCQFSPAAGGAFGLAAAGGVVDLAAVRLFLADAGSSVGRCSCWVPVSLDQFDSLFSGGRCFWSGRCALSSFCCACRCGSVQLVQRRAVLLV